MLENISILITGNPISTNGYSEIGKLGIGLVKTDPTWPTNARGDFVVLITERENATIYCLMLHESQISSEAADRGILNFQLRIPFGYAITDSNGDKVSPFNFLWNLFTSYEAVHLTKYSRIPGWNFSGDGKMTDEEIKQFISSYSQTQHNMSPRRLSGKDKALIVLNREGIEAITLDYAYPELARFGEIILSEKGMTTPGELSRLEIPRIITYDIYVNGKKQDCIVREGEEAFALPVQPVHSYQLPKSLKVDFKEAKAKGLVDEINERINYTVEFEDKTKEHTVKVKLTGCEGKQELYKNLIKIILNGISLQGLACSDVSEKTDLAHSSKVFILKGRATAINFNVRYGTLPANVYFEKQNVKSETCDELEFSYNGQDEPGEERPQTATLNIYVCAKDEDILEDMRGTTFDLELSVLGRGPVLKFKNLECENLQVSSLGKSKTREKCYVNKIEVQTSFLNVGRPDVVCDNADFDLNGGDLQFDKGTNTYSLIIDAYPVGWFSVLKPKLIKWTVLLCVFAFGWLIGEVWRPYHSFIITDNALTHSDTTATEKGAAVTEETGDTTLVEPVKMDTDITLSGATETGGVNGDLKQKEDPVPGSETKELSNQANEYLNLIKTTDLTFDQVYEINNWLKVNSANSGPIKGYGQLKSVMAVYTQATNYVKSIFGDWGVNFPGELNKFIKNLPRSDEYKKLRIKMQNLNKENKAEDKDVGTILLEFKVKHPNGISSFGEIQKP